MKIIQVISENKHTKKLIVSMMVEGKEMMKAIGHKSKIGCCEAIVEENGELVTRHCVPMGGKNE